MSRLWTSGAELNSNTLNMEFSRVEGSPPIVTSPVRTGTYSVQIANLVSGQPEYVGVTFLTSDTLGNYFFRFYIYVVTYPNNPNRIFDVRTNGNAHRVGITMNSSGQLQLIDEDGNIGSASSAIPQNTWTRIEVNANLTPSAGSHVITGRINGSNFATASNRNISSGVSHIRIGANNNGEAQTQGEWYIDDIAINDNSGTYENTWPGDGKVVRLKPNAAGDNNAWDTLAGGGASSNNYQTVDEVTPNDGTDGVRSRTTGQIDDYNIEDFGVTGAVVNVMEVHQRLNRSAGTTGSAGVARLKPAASGTVIEGAAQTPTSTTWRTNNQGNNNTVPPTLTSYLKADGTVWTPTDVDSAQIGARITSGSGDRYYHISTTWLNVDYTPVPEVTLNSPANAGSVSDTTPDLDFTGTDPDGDSLEYQVQIDTVNTFDSTWDVGPSYDTSVVQNGNGVNSFTFPALSTAEDGEVLICGIHFSNATPSGITFSGDLTWTKLGTEVTIPNSGGEIYHYWALAPRKLTDAVFTATFTGGGFPQVSGIISAYKGVDTSSPIGDHQTGTANFTTSVSATVTTTRANSRVIAITGQVANNAMSPGSGETEATETASAGGFSRANSTYQDNITSSASTSVTMDVTIPLSSSMGMRAIELKAPAAPAINVFSETDSGFVNPDTGGDTHPFNSGENIQYTVQTTLSEGTTYYWRVRAIAPGTDNLWGPWSSTRSFTVSSARTISVNDSVTVTDVPNVAHTLNISSPFLVTENHFVTNTLPDGWTTFGSSGWSYSSGRVNFATNTAGDPNKLLDNTHSAPIEREVQAIVKWTDDPTGDARMGITVHGDNSNGRGVNLVHRSDGNKLSFLYDGVQWFDGPSFDPTLNQDYWFKARYQNGHYLGKVWATNASEPSSWMIDWTFSYPGSAPNHGLTGNSNSEDGGGNFDDYTAYGLGDEISVTESVTVSIITPAVTEISVVDTITVSESVTVLITPLVPSVFDAITVTESVTVARVSNISVSDSITVTDVPNVAQVYTISLSDSVAVSEAVFMTQVYTISKFEAITVTESITVHRIFCITVNDAITVTDVRYAVARDKNYSIGTNVASLPSTSANLSLGYTQDDYEDVATSDDERVST